MKVFIGTKVPRGNLLRTETADLAVEAAQQAGHHPFLATREIQQNSLDKPGQFMPFVRQHIHESDLVLILYDQELRGGLIEEGIAYAQGIPVWLLHRAGEPVSSSARGCAERVLAYRDLEDLRVILADAFSSLTTPNPGGKTP